MNNDNSIIPSKPVAIYARVSTARQEEDGTIANQLGVLREFSQKNDLTIVKEYIDDGWSGDILARPALDELRADVGKKIWNSVLIYDPDRLARRYSYQELVMDELRERNVEVIFTTVSAPKNSEEKIMHGVRGLFAEYERAKITVRFRLGKVRKIKEGHVLVSVAPFGYKYIPKQGGEHGYFVIDDVEAIVVKLIFELVANDHLTLRQIVRRLQEMGVKPRKSSRGLWNTSTLSTLLRNGAYVGEAHWNASYSVVPERPLKATTYRKVKKTSRRNRPREDWYVVAVPAIIDKQLFERARAQLDANLLLSKRNKKNEYLLAGKIRCVCGRTKGGEGVLNGKHLYYRCSDRVLRYPLPRVCQERGINARIADELVWNAIAELMTSPGLMLSHLEDWISSKRKELGSPLVDSETLERERTSLAQQVDRHSKAYAAGLHNIEELRHYVEPLKRRIAEIANVLSDIKSGKRQRAIEIPKPEVLERYADEVRPALKNLSFSQKRAIVIHAVEKIVGTPRELRVSGFIPVEDHVEFETNHRHGLNVGGQNKGIGSVPFELTIRLPPPQCKV